MAEPLRRIRPETSIGPQTTRTLDSEMPEPERARERAAVRHAYHALHLGFIAAPLIAGFDKFFYRLTNWDQYLAPQIPAALGINAQNLMLIVGVVEIIAGLGVAFKPRVFGYIVCAWLLGIVANLLMTGQYYDIALRDIGLALGAFALARLSSLNLRRI